MTLWRLVTREILHRKLSFALGLFAVAVAVGCFVAVLTMLRAHDLGTTAVLEAKAAQMQAEVARRAAEAKTRGDELEEAYRTIMLKFGYNLFIMPKQESVVGYQVQGGPSSYMDESDVRVLSESGILTVRHLLPVLQQRQILVFGDKRLEVFLVGTRGEAPIAHRDEKEPLTPVVKPGEMIVGSGVQRELALKVGDAVKVVDREFKVSQCYPARGTADDGSVWISLKEAQELLGKPGKINGILALSCICSHAELEKIINEDILRILPQTQVRVMASNAVVRYEARVRAAEEAQAQVRLAREQGRADLERERASRAAMRREIETFGAWVVPLLVVAAAVWLALLAQGNVRERRGEIGILRALGLRSRQIFGLFLTRSLLVGAAGAVVGCAAGLLLVGSSKVAPPGMRLFDPALTVAVLIAAPLLSVIAGLMPAMTAAHQDPAEILREE